MTYNYKNASEHVPTTLEVRSLSTMIVLVEGESDWWTASGSYMSVDLRLEQSPPCLQLVT